MKKKLQKPKMDLIQKLIIVDKTARLMHKVIGMLLKDLPTGFVWKAPEDDRCRIIEDPPMPLRFTMDPETPPQPKFKSIRKELDKCLRQAEKDGLLEKGAAMLAAKRAKFIAVSSDTIAQLPNGIKASSRSSKTGSSSSRARRFRQNVKR